LPDMEEPKDYPSSGRRPNGNIATNLHGNNRRAGWLEGKFTLFKATRCGRFFFARREQTAAMSFLHRRAN